MNKLEVFNNNVEFAVIRLRAIRALPKTEGTERAQRKILNHLNLNETTEVALRLSAIEQQDQLNKTHVPVNTPGPQKEDSHGR